MAQSSPQRKANPSATGGAGSSSKHTKTAPRPQGKSPVPVKNNRSTYIIVGASLAVIAIIAVLFVVSSNGTPEVNDVDAARQFQEVKINGTALPDAPGSAEVADTAVGLAAPAVSGKYFDGTPTELLVAGKPTMIVFAAHWCPHCNAEIPIISGMINDGAAEGIDTVAVATSSDQNKPYFPPETWLKGKMGWKWKTIADDKSNSLAAAYGVTGFPTMVFIGADGLVKARTSGEQPKEKLQELFDKIKPAASNAG